MDEKEQKRQASQIVIKAMKDCDMVFHLAALISIPYSYLAPSSYIDTNIQGTLNVLQAVVVNVKPDSYPITTLPEPVVFCFKAKSPIAIL